MFNARTTHAPHTYAGMHAHMLGCTYPCTHSCMHPCMRPRMHVYMHAYIHACIHACIHASKLKKSFSANQSYKPYGPHRLYTTHSTDPTYPTNPTEPTNSTDTADPTDPTDSINPRNSKKAPDVAYPTNLQTLEDRPPLPPQYVLLRAAQGGTQKWVPDWYLETWPRNVANHLSKHHPNVRRPSEMNPSMHRCMHKCTHESMHEVHVLNA